MLKSTKGFSQTAWDQEKLLDALYRLNKESTVQLFKCTALQFVTILLYTVVILRCRCQVHWIVINSVVDMNKLCHRLD